MFNFYFLIFTTLLFIAKTSIGETKLPHTENLQYTPQINGKLTNKTEPIGDQNVYLRIGLSAYGKSLEISTKTDNDGRFSFAPVSGEQNSLNTPLIEHYVTIVVSVELDSEKTVVIWEGSYDGYDLDDYLIQNMKNLNCDVTNPLKYFAFSIDEDGNDDYYFNSQCELRGYMDSDLYDS
ncbi:DUF6795 domain-containing protein [Vibrio rotiferianus]|uniref:DUF6795 domain-containing protein n=1 Tax=Vibrio rotiferianus TaxID=190895 RepID=UPI001F0E1C68|nr:DUF6795 domain-containing protein [Vibrio rotiferianus]